MNNLTILRKQNNFTMKELGLKFNLSESTISLYESGKREPDFETLKRIADFFNVSTDYLLGRNTLSANASSDAFKDTKNKLINALGNRNISVQDLNKLTQDDINMLLSLLEKFIKEKK